MNVECGICKDTYVNFQNLTAAPCGHVFHEACISNWLNMGTRTCPQCRKPTSKKSALKLFFDQVEPDEDTPEDVASLVGRNNCLKSEVMTLKSEVSILHEKLITANDQVEGIKSLFIESEQKSTRLEREALFMLSKAKQSDKLKKELSDMKKLYEMARGENERLKSFRQLNTSNMEEPELRELSNSLTKEDLVELVCSSKREQKKLIRSECSLASDLRSVNRENTNLLIKIQKLESTNSMLQQIVDGYKERRQSSPLSDLPQRFFDKSFDPYGSFFFETDEENEAPSNNNTPETIKSRQEEPVPSTSRQSGSSFILSSPKLKLSTEYKEKKLMGPKPSIFKPARVKKLENVVRASSDVAPVFYNGLGGTSRLETFPKLRPCKIVTNKKNKK